MGRCCRLGVFGCEYVRDLSHYIDRGTHRNSQGELKSSECSLGSSSSMGKVWLSGFSIQLGEKNLQEI